MRSSRERTRADADGGGGATAPCPACATAATPFLRVGGVPVIANELWPSREAARAAGRGQVTLALCPACGLVHNPDFDPDLVDYSPRYENSLHFSPTFQRYARGLASDLVARHGLQGRSVLEIGAGKGEFLDLLLQAGVGRATGFDPAFEPGGRDSGGEVVTDLYRGDTLEEPPALVYGRHVLEHVAAPGALLASVRRATPGAAFYLEVPDARAMLSTGGIWDVIYEHVTYFTDHALARLLREVGLRVTEVTTAYSGQYLQAHGTIATDPDSPGEGGMLPPPRLDELQRDATRFASAYREMVDRWDARLRDAAAAGRKVAVWGAGSKGITFLNVVPGAALVETVVDVNPRKHGRHVPGTGQQVEAPAALRSRDVDTVLVMNAVYAGEIRGMLSELEVRADVETV